MKKFFSILLLIHSICDNSYSQITWNTGTNVAASSFDNLRPRIATDGSGNPIVIWGKTTDQSVYIARWNGTAFTTPMKVNPTTMTVATATWMGPEMASHGDTVYVVFKETPENDVASKSYITTSTDGGISFSPPVMLDNFPDSISRFPVVSVDANGNPIAAYMKFHSSFADPRWVVEKSSDLGNTFSTDVKASGWSSATSEVCDCCPGAIACSGNSIAMMYRDNNSNIRDTWCGISSDGGNTFPSGRALDQNNWMLMSCPSSGPDGVIIGDTLYSTYMNGGSGNDLVYFSKNSVLSGANSNGIEVTGTIAGLSWQNYPRMASSGSALALIWKQVVNGQSQLLLRFTDSIMNGLPMMYDTVDIDNITNADIAIDNGNIYIVWEDDGSGTVKFISGTYEVATPNIVSTVCNNSSIEIFPNPSSNFITVSSPETMQAIYAYEILDVAGRSVKSVFRYSSKQEIDISDLPSGNYFLQPWACYYMPEAIEFSIQK